MDIKKKIEKRISDYIMSEILKIVQNPASPVEAGFKLIDRFNESLDALFKNK